MMTTNRLANIATAQRKTRVRDALFVACVALASVVALTSVSTACDASHPVHVAQR
jgi:hypothetical protein